MRNKLFFIGVLIVASLLLAGCDPPDISLAPICKINYVQVSHKDTKITQQQNAANNGTLQGVGCPFKTLYSLP